MKHPFYILSALLMCCLLVSCDEDKQEATDVAFFITPKASQVISVNAGEVQRYEMELHTTHDFISKINISSYTSIEGKKVLTDSTLTSHLDKFVFDYKAPHFNRDSVIVTLTFEAWDNEGGYGSTDRTLIVKSNTILIPEKSGIVLRSSESGFPDAFSFRNASKTFNWKNSPDSIYADIYLVANTDFSTLAFKSNTKAKMVRINNFDYSAATALNIQNVYTSSLLSDGIDDLKINDIILVGHNESAEGALFLTNIIHSGDDSERCVQLSFKGIE